MLFLICTQLSLSDRIIKCNKEYPMENETYTAFQIKTRASYRRVTVYTHLATNTGKKQ